MLSASVSHSLCILVLPLKFAFSFRRFEESRAVTHTISPGTRVCACVRVRALTPTEKYKLADLKITLCGASCCGCCACVRVFCLLCCSCEFSEEKARFHYNARRQTLAFFSLARALTFQIRSSRHEKGAAKFSSLCFGAHEFNTLHTQLFAWVSQASNIHLCFCFKKEEQPFSLLPSPSLAIAHPQPMVAKSTILYIVSIASIILGILLFVLLGFVFPSQIQVRYLRSLYFCIGVAMSRFLHLVIPRFSD